jgi:hypothetical protein
MGETTHVSRPTVVQLAESDPIVACTLEQAEMGDRMLEWQSALKDVEQRVPLDDGVRLTFGPDADIAELARLARSEWACCSFFSFAITVDARGTALEVRAPDDARQVVQSVFGVAS